MSTLKQRLEELSADKGRGWMASLARHCKVKPPSVSDWVSGKTKSLEGDNLILVASFFGVTPEWMASGKGQKFADVNIHTDTKAMSEGGKIIREINLDANPDYPAIRRVNFKLSAGARHQARPERAFLRLRVCPKKIFQSFFSFVRFAY